MAKVERQGNLLSQEDDRDRDGTAAQNDTLSSIDSHENVVILVTL